MDLHPLQLDKELSRAVRALAGARRELSRTGAWSGHPDGPLAMHRVVSSRSAWLDLEEAAQRQPSDPLLPALATWTRALTLERVLWADAVRVAGALHAPTIELEKPEPVRISPRELTRRVLAERSGPRRRLLAEGLAGGVTVAGEAVHVADERRAEARHRLGLEEPDSPTTPAEAVAALAEDLLRRTDAMLPELGPIATWSEAVPLLCGHRATEGWPARLGHRWVREMFESTPLTQGLALDLGPLPTAIGAASFARTLARFGAALAEADAPAVAFALSRHPLDVRAARRAALFGSLVADSLFGVRALNLSRAPAREQAREVARGFLLHLRLDATRVLLGRMPTKERSGRAEELTHRALGAPVPAALAGVVPLLATEDAVRLAGALLAAGDRRALIDRFDEDWWRNPEAATTLRHEHSIPPAPLVASPELDAGLTDLLAALGAVLT